MGWDDGAITEASGDGAAHSIQCARCVPAVVRPGYRLPVTPTAENGLRDVSRLMVDKLTTVHKSRLGKRIGRLNNADMARLDQAILVFLGSV